MVENKKREVKRVGFSVSTDTVEKLENICDIYNMKKSNFIEKIILNLNNEDIEKLLFKNVKRI